MQARSIFFSFSLIVILSVAVVVFLNQTRRVTAQQDFKPTNQISTGFQLGPAPAPALIQSKPSNNFGGNSAFTNSSIPMLSQLPPTNNQNGSSTVPARTATSPFAVKQTQLMRNEYLVPKDAAQTLQKLFEHKATALVESKISQSVNKEHGGLVKFVVTAEPQTQSAIQSFMRAVFPQKNITQYTKQITPPSEDSTSATGADPKQYTVVVSLPNMTCGGCVASVKQLLDENKMVADFEVDLETRTAKITVDRWEHVASLLAHAQDDNQIFKDFSIQID